MDSAVLSLTCAGLGAPEEDEDGGAVGYVKGEHCLDNLKDLQRLLRRDDPERREVFKQVCKWKIASRDLVPIIENYQADRNLVITAVKVLVFLTMPVDPSSEDVAQQIEYLWDLKAALTRNVAIAVIVSLLEDPLDHLERTAFTEDDWKLVQLVLTLFRNLLAVQEITLPQKASGEATQLLFLADSFLELMFQENMMDLILVLTQHIDEPSGYLKHENLLLLEIFHYLFLGRDPELIAKVRTEGSKDQVNRDIDTSIDSLRLMMEKEDREKKMFRQRNAEQHSHNGIFTFLSMDGSKSLCKGNPSSAIASANSLRKIRSVQKGPQKRIAWDNELLYIPKEGIMETLRSFLDQFLSGGYNVLMQSICDDIVKEHQSIEKSDNITFFKVVRFVLAFQHEKASNAQKSSAGPQISETSPSNESEDNLPFRGDICGPVAATLNEDMFNIVISRWRETYEDLKQTKDYKTLSAAGSLMKNMIGMIYLVLKVHPEDSRESQTARVLLYKLFYDQTEQGLTQFLLNLFRSFDTHKQPKSALADLVETIHIMLQLMEKLQSRGALRVAKRTRKGRKKKTSGDKNENAKPETENMETENMETENVETENMETENVETENVEQSYIDPTGGTKCTSDSLPDLRSEDPLAELTVPEEGKVDSNVTELPDTAVETVVSLEGTTQLGGDPSCAGSAEMKGNAINEEEDTSDSSADDCPPATSEADFNVSRLISSLANNSVVQNICWLLRHYKTNSFRTNHYIICMLRRFCEDLELSPMLYQLSLLTTFYDILAEQQASSSKEYANIVNFLSKVIRKMLRAMKKQPLLFVEILFWKSRKECHLIDADALLNEIKGDVNNNASEVGASKGWRGPVNIADSLGDDEADNVIPQEPYDADKDGDSSSGEREGDNQKSMGATNRRNRLLSLSGSDSEDNDRNTVSRRSQNSGVPKRRGRSIFNEEQEKLISDLYEKYKDDRKCSHLIAEALDPSGKISSAQISRKLTQLGLRNAKKRTKVPEAPLSAGDLATQPQNHTLDDPKPESTRRRRKRLHGLSSNHDNGANHPISSDEETLQALKSRTKTKELSSEDFSPSISQHQDEALQGTDSDDETIGSMLRGKKKRLSASDFTANGQEHQDSSKNMAPVVETIGLNTMDVSLQPESNSLDDNSGHAGEAELLDDFSEPEMDNRENSEQRVTNEMNMTESGDMGSSYGSQKAGSKRRNRLVIDDDDDDE
ncbi:uncharacterized protein [Lolium perenne]|uniref:uncharacterized protein isoform X2 n=1 Tax=Lolium perenne TaxID=4522 RepID=UPI0021F68DB2|nr:uncharacterized protein LOC127327697 isoform X2 [Lolium perenne]